MLFEVDFFFTGTISEVLPSADWYLDEMRNHQVELMKIIMAVRTILKKKTTYALLKTPRVVALPFMYGVEYSEEETAVKPRKKYIFSASFTTVTVYCQLCLPQEDVSGLGELDL